MLGQKLINSRPIRNIIIFEIIFDYFLVAPIIADVVLKNFGLDFDFPSKIRGNENIWNLSFNEFFATQTG